MIKESNKQLINISHQRIRFSYCRQKGKSLFDSVFKNFKEIWFTNIRHIDVAMDSISINLVNQKEAVIMLRDLNEDLVHALRLDLIRACEMNQVPFKVLNVRQQMQQA